MSEGHGSHAENVKAVLALMNGLDVDVPDLILWGHIDEDRTIVTRERAFDAIHRTADLYSNDDDMHAYQVQADAVTDALEEVGLLRDDETDEHPAHDVCADGCGLDVNHDGPCLDEPYGRQVCAHYLHAHVFQGQRLVHDHPHTGPHGYFGHDEDAGMPEEPGWDSDVPYVDLSIEE